MNHTDDRSVLEDFTAEQTELYQLLVTLDEQDWAKPTPAAGWDVRDQVAHLAHTEEVARDTAVGGPRNLAEEAAKYSSPEAFTEAGCELGRALKPLEVLDWWWTAAARNREALAGLDTSTRIPWGLGMGWRAFVTARLMEHWAHGLDIRAAVDRPGQDTARLRQVAWICISALPYAFGVAGVEPPPDRSLRVELEQPPGAGQEGQRQEGERQEGDRWCYGPEDATDLITGPAGEFCRRAIQRAGLGETPNLRADGPLAELALRHARAFL